MDTRSFMALDKEFKELSSNILHLETNPPSFETYITKVKKLADKFQQTVLALKKDHLVYYSQNEVISCREYMFATATDIICKEFIQDITLGNKSAYTTLTNRMNELLSIEFVKYAREHAEILNLKNQTLRDILNKAITQGEKIVINYLRTDAFDKATDADPGYMLTFAFNEYVNLDKFRLILKKSDDLNPMCETEELFDHLLSMSTPLLDAKTRLEWLMYEAMLRNDEVTLYSLAKSWFTHRDKNTQPNCTPDGFQEFLGETLKPTNAERENLNKALKHMERIGLISKETQSEMLRYLDPCKVGNVQAPDSNLLYMQEYFLRYLTEQIASAQKLTQELQQLRDGFKLFAVPAPVGASEPAPVSTVQLSAVVK